MCRVRLWSLLYFARLCFARSCVFFFQAEDGIRDGHVTGVQTCALPIFLFYISIGLSKLLFPHPHQKEAPASSVRRWFVSLRSEERRVGKECRSRWSPAQ